MAFLSYSTFGNPEGNWLDGIRGAVSALDARECAFEYEGEMAPDVALNPNVMKNYPFCRLSGPANVLIMPGLQSGNLSAKLLRELGSGTIIGPDAAEHEISGPDRDDGVARVRTGDAGGAGGGGDCGLALDGRCGPAGIAGCRWRWIDFTRSARRGEVREGHCSIPRAAPFNHVLRQDDHALWKLALRARAKSSRIFAPSRASREFVLRCPQSALSPERGHYCCGAPAPGAPTAPMLPKMSSKKLRSRPSVGVASPLGLIRAIFSRPVRSTATTLPAASNFTCMTVCATGAGWRRRAGAFRARRRIIIAAELADEGRAAQGFFHRFAVVDAGGNRFAEHRIDDIALASAQLGAAAKQGGGNQTAAMAVRKRLACINNISRAARRAAVARHLAARRAVAQAACRPGERLSRPSRNRYAAPMALFDRIFRRAADPRDTLRPLWHAVVARARAPHWYEDGAVPDTLDGRFDMVALILSLVLLRIEAAPEHGRDGVLLTEIFVDDMDGQMRQIGFGDMTRRQADRPDL